MRIPCFESSQDADLVASVLSDNHRAFNLHLQRSTDWTVEECDEMTQAITESVQRAADDESRRCVIVIEDDENGDQAIESAFQPGIPMRDDAEGAHALGMHLMGVVVELVSGDIEEV